MYCQKVITFLTARLGDDFPEFPLSLSNVAKSRNLSRCNLSSTAYTEKPQIKFHFARFDAATKRR